MRIDVPDQKLRIKLAGLLAESGVVVTVLENEEGERHVYAGIGNVAETAGNDGLDTPTVVMYLGQWVGNDGAMQSSFDDAWVFPNAESAKEACEGSGFDWENCDVFVVTQFRKDE